MANCSLEEDRTLYRHLLEKELENGKHLLQEREENSENKVQNKDVSKCICRLNALQQKLEDTIKEFLHSSCFCCLGFCLCVQFC